MIVYLCNKCKKPIDLTKKDCVHLQVTCGSEAIYSGGQASRSGGCYSIDLCEGCYKSTIEPIGCFSHVANMIMKEQV